VAEVEKKHAAGPVNAELLLPYFAPYGAYVLIANLAGSLPRELDYVLRIVVTGALLFMFRKRYQPLRGPGSVKASVLTGVIAGFAGVFLWVLLILPFNDIYAGEPVSSSAFLMRVIAATTVVALAEELLCRGYIMGFITQWQEARKQGAAQPFSQALDERSVHAIPPGAATVLAVVISSIAFAAGHSPPQWLAAFGYGVLMAGLWILRKDLLTPIIAHAVTNLVLYIYVFRSGAWGLW
jgi:membrane protease YdiL (CAAX protease family)